MRLATARRQEWEKTAIFYLNNYEQQWRTWVTDDAYNNIKDALECTI